ncbi:cytochrome P450 [Mycolicibacterium chitae]|uniref:Cytochrome P450 107B1 n=1 Tax=Mycolicibacterium chitae TaxID=1792 RepID=A0A3S4TNL8_MYCCI|nr:cytochrome P450 [Mycolicibacterium chitae]MCV7104464.1 cytochrome P450 [Mycolicibacterium chitae]BBZ05470.1 cytochrome P450 [Mycolicibacterium chitae]VEG49085.1 cytochrome P450 107B1 [Mycolicibacterium chitae]
MSELVDKGLPADLQTELSGYSSYTSTPDRAMELFAEARAAGCPVPHSDELGGFYLALDHDLVRKIHSDWETFSHYPTVVLPVVERPAFPPIEMDPPEHTMWRELVAKAFNADTAGRFEEGIREDINLLIDNFAAKGSCDLVEEFCEEVPLYALCRIIGFDLDKRATVRDMTLRLVAAFEDPEEGPKAFLDFAMFGAQEVMARKENPKDDFLTDLANAELNGQPLGPLEIGQIMNSFLVAGHGTSVAVLGSILHEVLSRPELTERLKADPEMIPSAVEETLRLHPPFFGLYKRATRDVELGGTQIPKDSYIQTCWAAANRDPKVYENPDEFDVDRKFGRKNRHLTFGFGIHSCPGAPTARMELRIAVEELLRRLPDITLVDPSAAKYEFHGTETAAIGSLPATFTPAP